MAESIESATTSQLMRVMEYMFPDIECTRTEENEFVMRTPSGHAVAIKSEDVTA